MLVPFVTGCGEEDPTAVGDTTIQIDTTLAQFSPLSTVGGRVALESDDVLGLPPNGVFILRIAPTAATVLDRTCTYQRCQVSPFVGDAATCPCSGSQYNTSGGVRSGPAVFPLREFPSTVQGHIIVFRV
jgi:Rieske Fe-S protein